MQKLIPHYLLILAVAIFYSGVYDNAFLYDDKYLIVDNTYLRDWNHIGDMFRSYATSGAFRAGHFYRPLQNLLYLVIYQAFGPSEIAFHAVNIILHAANACMMFALGKKMKFGESASFFAALIWAVHPIHTEAVAYMSSTADMMFTGFSLGALLVLLPDFTPKKFLIATPLFALALLSKETAIVLPLLVMACMFGLRQPKVIYFRTWPLWVTALLYFTWRQYVAPFHTGDLSNIDPVSKEYVSHISIRISTFLATIPAYLQLLIWPEGLHMDRDFPAY
ncbi:MAG TPA: glycosyltransferase family 39 protein, partial [Alphaproteobacteria bacterium]|nr:glycosyltransferase family 39 protein [Alphaproteobacteria bacterium]